jgi:hypothetical protein
LRKMEPYMARPRGRVQRLRDSFSPDAATDSSQDSAGTLD